MKKKEKKRVCFYFLWDGWVTFVVVDLCFRFVVVGVVGVGVVGVDVDVVVVVVVMVVMVVIILILTSVIMLVIDFDYFNLLHKQVLPFPPLSCAESMYIHT